MTMTVDSDEKVKEIRILSTDMTRANELCQIPDTVFTFAMPVNIWRFGYPTILVGNEVMVQTPDETDSKNWLNRAMCRVMNIDIEQIEKLTRGVLKTMPGLQFPDKIIAWFNTEQFFRLIDFNVLYYMGSLGHNPFRRIGPEDRVVLVTLKVLPQ